MAFDKQEWLLELETAGEVEAGDCRSRWVHQRDVSELPA